MKELPLSSVLISEPLYSLSQECLVVDKNRVGTYACWCLLNGEGDLWGSSRVLNKLLVR
jgi:hypothetical protein